MKSISEFKFFGNIVFEVVFQVEILNPWSPFHINKTKIELIVVIAVNSWKVREEFISKKMIPTQIYQGIAVSIGKVFAKYKTIATKIARKI